MQNSAVWTVAISGDDMKVAIGLESGALKVVDSWTGEYSLRNSKHIRNCVFG